MGYRLEDGRRAVFFVFSTSKTKNSFWIGYYRICLKRKTLQVIDLQSCFRSGGKTRTYDLWVMSPTSYQLLHPAILKAQK